MTTLAVDGAILQKQQSMRGTAFLLGLCMFFTGASGLVTEYVLSTVSTYILGNAVEQFSITIAVMMCMMGLGGYAQRFIGDEGLAGRFIAVEIALSLVGGFAPILLFTAFGYLPNHFPLVQYALVSSIGFMIGFEIPLVIRINKDSADHLKGNLALVFCMDYVGACAGAFIWAFVLLKHFPLPKIALMVSASNLFVALLTFIYMWRKGMIERVWRFVAAFGVVIALFSAGHVWGTDWTRLLEQRFYEDPIRSSTMTKYQQLTVTENPKTGDWRLYINGNVQFSSLDEDRYHEALVHPVMAVASSHKRVLILGGGDGLALKRVLSYPDVEKVLLVDLDPVMTKLARENAFLSKMNGGAFRDARVVSVPGKGIESGGPKSLLLSANDSESDTPARKGKSKTTALERAGVVEVMNIDADRFVDSAVGEWDVVIIDFPDPNAIELTKLYSREFYLKLRRSLAKDARIVVQSTSPYHAKEAYLCIMRTLEAAGYSVIPYHENIPSFGDWGFHLAWVGGENKDEVRHRLSTLSGFAVSTTYLTPELLRAELAFGKGLLNTREVIINTLMQPALLTYYLDKSWIVE